VACSDGRLSFLLEPSHRRQLLDPFHGFRAERHRLEGDARLAQPFHGGRASIERLDQLA